MRVLNIGCGGNVIHRAGWVNLDMSEGSEPDFVRHDLLAGPMPIEDGTFDAVIASHVIEHFDCMEAARVMADCHRVLKSGGEMVVSVPDASYFRKVHYNDCVENSIALFGEVIHYGEKTFTNYALWHAPHKAVLTEDALWHYFVRTGFTEISTFTEGDHSPLIEELRPALNRWKFSLFMKGRKP